MAKFRGKSISHQIKSGTSLTDIIHESQAKNEKSLSKNAQDMWYHGRLTRGNAVHNLKKSGNEEGKFLVRESINIHGCFVISIMHNNSVQHFQIATSRHSGCYSIDNGPQFVGLDQLIAFYRSGANGLPTALTYACVPGNVLPPSLRQYGENTVVHQAINEALDTATFRKILDHPACPNLNTRNTKGTTALQEACKQGHNDLVLELYKYGADVSARDADGNSALHIACRFNRPDTCKILIKHCHAKTQDRCCGSGWVPLHEAASHGHHQCVDALLQLGAACYARCVNDETPLDVARKRKHRKCIQTIEHFVPPKPSAHASEWLHKTLDRYKAVETLEFAGLMDGSFLVRISKRNPGQHVLTMACDKTVFNYEIKNRIVDNVKRFFIDDGPYFQSLEHLIDYYSHSADGLPFQLSKPVSPRDCLSGALNGFQFKNDDRPPMELPPAGYRPPLTQKPQIPPHGAFPPPHCAPSPPPTLRSNSDHIISPQWSQVQVELTEIERESLAIGRELGQGEFGSVLMGVWSNPNGETLEQKSNLISAYAATCKIVNIDADRDVYAVKLRIPVPVALKTLHEDHLSEGETDFKREAEVMMSLNHKCIVKLYGVCRGEHLMMVQELVSMGSALDYILDYPNAVNLQDFKLWAAQIASGMNYLESKGFVHRDLALRNILLASKQLVKISDFGLSRAVGAGSDYYKASAGGRWPVKWYAPESINYGTFSSSSDVWSYGVTLWEMFSRGNQPYENMTGAQVIQFLEDDRRRLLKPEGCPDKVYSIMFQCWAYEPKDRPTFRRLHSKFRNDPDYFNIQVPGHSQH